MEMGSARDSNSAIPRLIGSLIPGLTGMKGGAPRASWSALAPIILALSKRVSFGGPIRIFGR